MNRACSYFAVLAIAAGVLLPPAALVNLALPVAYASYATGYIRGLWLLKILLCGGGVAAWLLARRTPESWRTGAPGMIPPAFAAWEYGFLVFVGLASIALRLPGLDGSLTYDEVFLIRTLMTQNPLKAFFHPSGSAHLLHTLFANGVLRFWEPAAWSARLPAFIVGSLSPIFLYLAIKRVLTRRTAVIAALLLIAAPMHVWYSQEAKGNSFLVCGVILSWWFSARLAAGWNARDALGCLVTLVAVGASHLSGIMYVVAIGAALAIMSCPARARVGDIGHCRNMLLLHLGAAWIILMLYSPIMPFLFDRGGTGYITEGAPRLVPLLGGMLNQFTMLDLAWPWLLAPLLLVAAGAIVLWRARPILLALLALVLAIDLAVTVGFRLFSFPRYHMYFLPATAVMMAAGGAGAWEWSRGFPSPLFRKAAAVAIAVIGCALIGGYGMALKNYYSRPKSNYAAAAGFIRGRSAADPVYVIGRDRKGYPASALLFYADRFETDDTIGRVLQDIDPRKGIAVIAIDPLHIRVSYPGLWRVLNSQATSAMVWTCHGELDQYRVRFSQVFEIPAGTIAALVNKGVAE